MSEHECETMSTDCFEIRTGFRDNRLYSKDMGNSIKIIYCPFCGEKLI